MRARIRPALLVALATSLLVPPGAQAQSYPSRTVTVVVANPPGGLTDVIARIVAQGLTTETGQSFIVENVAGASSRIGFERVARSKPDGYTLLLNSDTQIYMPGMYSSLLYKPIEGFEPVSILVEVPLVVCVSKAIKADNLHEFIALAKSSSKELTYGSGGIGTANQIGGVLFAKLAGITMRHVPYKGGGPVVNDLSGGQLDAAFLTTSAVAPFILSGAIKGLAVASKQRSPLLPDVPTSAEAGMPDYIYAPWAGIAVPAGTSHEIVGSLNATLIKVINTPTIHERLAKLGTVLGTTPEEAQAKISQQAKDATILIHDAGIATE